jgi:hypothetical protein
MLPIRTVGFIVIGSANEQHTIKIAKRVKAFYNWVRGFLLMLAQYVQRFSDRWYPGATLFSFASSNGDPDDHWLGRFEFTKASLRFLHFSATTGAR